MGARVAGAEAQITQAAGGAQGSFGSVQHSHTFSHCVTRCLYTLEAVWAP